MGFKDNRKHPPVSPTALSAVSKIQNRDISIQKTDSKDITTLRRGELLGIGKPIWLKVQESESRLAWLSEMVRKELVVRDICSYAKSIGSQLRSDE